MGNYRPKIPKIRLDYSCLPEERKREDRAERLRREKLDNYNEATFGRKHPLRSAITRHVGVMAFLTIVALFLPSGLPPLHIAAGVALIALTLWEGLHFGGKQWGQESLLDAAARWLGSLLCFLRYLMFKN